MIDKVRHSKIFSLLSQHRVYIFPLVCTVILICLVSLQISGTSVGVYHDFLYGDKAKDPHLLYGKPRPIRSDEWVVNTQMTAAQMQNDYQEVNHNLGNGMDMSLVIDAPYKGFTQLFKPHNFAFFVLPFDMAFAFKWWIMAYFLIISAYFFTLAILPKRYTLAILLSLALFFAPFIQWWYQYVTLAPLYCSLFATTIFIYLTKARSRKAKILLTGLLTYATLCFAFVIYPPFQIPCLLVTLAFIVGYLIQLKKEGTLELKSILTCSLIAGITAVSIVGISIYQKRDVFHTLQNTAYPGKRVVASGNYDLQHLLSNHLNAYLQSSSRAAAYSVPKIGAVNQSESSNFILLLPFLLLPIIFLWLRGSKKTRYYPLFSTAAIFVIFLIWLFVPHLPVIGTLTQLDKVPHTRLLIGLGLLNFIIIVLFIRYYQKLKTLSLRHSLSYSFLVWFVVMIVSWNIHTQYPSFLGIKGALAFSLPLPIIIFFLLRKRLAIALSGLLIFSIFSTYMINPLYRSTEILTQNKVSRAIRDIGTTNNKTWVIEDSYLQSFAFMNGEHSLTGVYIYPDLKLWKSLDQGKKEDQYNRYAHVNFVFDRDPRAINHVKFLSPSGDHFGLQLEPCSQFLKQNNVGYIVTSVEFKPETCLTLVKTIPYPMRSFYIYELNFDY